MKYSHSFFSAVSIVFSLLSGVCVSAQEGFLDTAFGINGITMAEKFEPKVVCIQQDGKILVGGGISTPDSMNQYIICRFNTDGTPDTGFGINGKMQAGIADRSEVIVGISQLPNGKILALGTSYYIGAGEGSEYMTFLRINTNGSLDATFGNGGFLNRGFGEMRSSPCKMQLLPNGKIIVAGSYRIPAASGNGGAPPPRPAIARFNANLTYDTTFNGTGYNVPEYFHGPLTTFDVMNDGSITGIATIGTGASANIRIYKFLANGTTDPAFGTNGLKTLNPGIGQIRISEIKGLGNGGFLLSGLVKNTYNSAVLFRVLPDGSLDPAFGVSGASILNNNSEHNEIAVGSLILENGDVVSGVQRWNTPGNYDYGLLGTVSSGVVNTSFGNEGQIVTELGNNQMMTCLIRQPDGKIIAAGYDENNMVLMRYDILGALTNPSFEKAKITVSPNPANDGITISGLPEGTAVSLYNISGQKLMEAVTAGDTQIDISGLAKGMYFLNTAKGSAKIIKK